MSTLDDLDQAISDTEIATDAALSIPPTVDDLPTYNAFSVRLSTLADRCAAASQEAWASEQIVTEDYAPPQDSEAQMQAEDEEPKHASKKS